VGVVGFCLGGGLAFAVACHGTVDAAAPNYGTAPPQELLAQCCPVVASYGGRDRIYARHGRRVLALQNQARDDIKIYPEAGHSFMNQPDDHRLLIALTRPLLATGFNREAAEDAWGRIGAFLGRHLDPAREADS
jgi:carboxymethylenebutenolidase